MRSLVRHVKSVSLMFLVAIAVTLPFDVSRAAPVPVEMILASPFSGPQSEYPGGGLNFSLEVEVGLVDLGGFFGVRNMAAFTFTNNSVPLPELPINPRATDIYFEQGLFGNANSGRQLGLLYDVFPFGFLSNPPEAIFQIAVNQPTLKPIKPGTDLPPFTLPDQPAWTGSRYQLYEFSFLGGLNPHVDIASGDSLQVPFFAHATTTTETLVAALLGGGDTRVGLGVHACGGAPGYDDCFVDTWPPSPIPVPAALPLFLSGLAGLGFFGWRRRRAA